MPEVIIYYHIYNKENGTIYLTQNTSQPVVSSRSLSGLFADISKVLAILGIGLILFTYAPSAFAWSKSVINANSANFSLSKTEIQVLSAPTVQVQKTNYLPPVDPRLSMENRLVIPSIGVDTTLQEATLDNYEDALKKGVWRVSNFGSPGDQSEPTILAAHRFGYLAWTNTYRRENSFSSLPSLEVGDTIEIDYQERRYYYEVYKADEGQEITDYSADLILYTCKNLTGSERVFRYARLIKI